MTKYTYAELNKSYNDGLTTCSKCGSAIFADSHNCCEGFTAINPMFLNRGKISR